MRTIVKSLVACMLIATPVAAQTTTPSLAKQGTFEATGIYISTAQAVVFEKELAVFGYTAHGTFMSAGKGGFYEGVSSTCVGTIRIVKGKPESEIGGCRAVDAKGDVFYSVYNLVGADASGVVLKGSYVGGTGKYVGLTGEFEARRQATTAPAKGHAASKSTIKGSYKLP